MVRYSIKENQLIAFFDLFVNCKAVLSPQLQRKICIELSTASITIIDEDYKI